MTNTGYREGIKLIRRSAQDGDQYLIRRIPRQKFMKFKTVQCPLKLTSIFNDKNGEPFVIAKQ